VAKNILTTRLRQLLDEGILELAPAGAGGRHSEYVLTPKGRELFPVIVALRQWGEAHFFRRNEPHSVLLDRVNNLPVRKLEVFSKDLRVLKPADTMVRKVSKPIAKQ
jgi:hypothetical protein